MQLLEKMEEVTYIANEVITDTKDPAIYIILKG